VIELFPEEFGPLRDGYVPAIQYLDGPEDATDKRQRLLLFAAGILAAGLIIGRVVSK